MADQNRSTEELLDADFYTKTDHLTNVLANLQSLQPENVRNTVQLLATLIRALYSTNGPCANAYKQLKRQPQGKIFLKKLQISYVYYYMLYLSLDSDFKKATKQKDEETNLKAIRYFLKVKKVGAPFYKIFNDILGGAISQRPENPFKEGANSLMNFWDTAISRASQHKDWNVNSLDNKEGGEGLTYDELVSMAEVTPKTFEETLKRDRELLDYLSNGTGDGRFISALLYAAGPVLSTLDVDDPDASFTLNLSTPLLKRLKDETTEHSNGTYGTAIAKCIESNKTLRDAGIHYDKERLKCTQSLFKPFIEKLLEYLNPKKVKQAPEDSDKEKTKKVDEATGLELDETNDVTQVVPLENQLALNIADYMTGKITAHEFQVRDRRIRNSLPLNHTDQLNENDVE